MMTLAEDCQTLAELLVYPAGRGERIAGEWLPRLISAHPSLGEAFQPLLEALDRLGESGLEELYARTFDNSADCALELGWHLHGENYARGALMVRLRQLLREAAVPESMELPDHLSNVVALMGKSDRDLSSALASQVVVPALRKIVEGFKDSTNPYRALLEGLLALLELEALEASPVQRESE